MTNYLGAKLCARDHGNGRKVLRPYRKFMPLTYYDQNVMLNKNSETEKYDMINPIKKHLKKITYISTGLFIIITAIIFFSRHLHPTLNQPTTETISLAPNTVTNNTQLSNTTTNTTPITSIPAAEAWVLNLNSNTAASKN